MPYPKTVQQLLEDARLKDQPYIATILTNINTGILSAMASETEYKTIYNGVTDLTGLGTLQQNRIIRDTMSILTKLGYKTLRDNTNNLQLTITWNIVPPFMPPPNPVFTLM
jgi:hypothetical protein